MLKFIAWNLFTAIFEPHILFLGCTVHTSISALEINMLFIVFLLVPPPLNTIVLYVSLYFTRNI